MASTKEVDWLVQIPDAGRDGVLQTRQEKLVAHLEHNRAHVEAGHVVMSGPVLAAHPRGPGEPLNITGSAMVWKAATEAQVRAWLREDPYAALGVWDLDRATVTAFHCAVRKPL